MDKDLKHKFLKLIKNVSLEELQQEDINKKFENMNDIFNIAKIIENYEEFEPDIKMMINRKAKKDKWRERGK